jgi:C_GCAxxG_C_C family probable redox protein
MNAVEKALDYARNEGLNCSQAIIAAFGEPLGIDFHAAKMLGRPWGGGMGHLAETCGYLTGAVLVLAHVYEQQDEGMARKKSFEAVRRLFEQFHARRGTAHCKELLGADMSTPEGLKRIQEEQLVKTICHGDEGIGQDVSEILAEIIADAKDA